MRLMRRCDAPCGDAVWAWTSAGSGVEKEAGVAVNVLQPGSGYLSAHLDSSAVGIAAMSSSESCSR